jgi:hypothetical protein
VWPSASFSSWPILSEQVLAAKARFFVRDHYQLRAFKPKTGVKPFRS